MSLSKLYLEKNIKIIYKTIYYIESTILKVYNSMKRMKPMFEGGEDLHIYSQRTSISIYKLKRQML